MVISYVLAGGDLSAHSPALDKLPGEPIEVTHEVVRLRVDRGDAEGVPLGQGKRQVL